MPRRLFSFFYLKPDKCAHNVRTVSNLSYASVPAFLFYCWLCVVSHFQVLREVAQLGLDNIENVQPFKNEDDDDSMMAAGYV